MNTPPASATAWLSLGANTGNPGDQLETAIEHLQTRHAITISARSRTTKTPAWGKTDQPDFYNLAVEIKTNLTPAELLEACLSTEREMGRERKEKWGPRLIDIDIIAYDRLHLQTPRLTLPHPLAGERSFVMDPLREISPATADWILSN